MLRRRYLAAAVVSAALLLPAAARAQDDAFVVLGADTRVLTARTSSEVTKKGEGASFLLGAGFDAPGGRASAAVGAAAFRLVGETASTRQVVSADVAVIEVGYAYDVLPELGVGLAARGEDGVDATVRSNTAARRDLAVYLGPRADWRLPLGGDVTAVVSAAYLYGVNLPDYRPSVVALEIGLHRALGAVKGSP